MKTSTFSPLLAPVVALLLLMGCNSSPETQPNATNTTVQQEVPDIRIKLECGTCKVRENVTTLIAKGYKDAVTKAGKKISATKFLDVSITDYTDRNDAARVLAGVFAGKDEIKTKVTNEGQSFVVEDYYRNAWLGIEHLSEKIGKMIFEKINS